MWIHLFAFRWLPDATEAQKDRATKEILAFQGVIPGLLEVHFGKNQSSRASEYESGGVMKFKDAEAFKNYIDHPAHRALVEWLPPLIEPVAVDLDVAPS